VATDTAATWVNDRLEKQIRWYSGVAGRCRLFYIASRLVTMLAALVITIVSITGWAPPGWQAPWLPGILGAVVVLVESVQGLFRWRDQWLMFRATAEGLKRERSLYAARAGPYAESAVANPLPLLAERTEELAASENATWRQLHDQANPPSTAGVGPKAQG
jgi:hypothetical protein